MDTFRFADVHGARLRYQIAGAGEPLILLHGFTLDLRMWDDQFEQFAQRFHVVRYDLRGFGQSTVPNGKPYCHADDLAALLDHLRIDRAHVMGLSLGGGIALDFACLHPDRLNRLVLVDTTLGGYPWRMRFDYKRGATTISDIRCNWLAHDFFMPALRNPAVNARLMQIVNDYSGWHWVNQDCDAFPPPSVYERLETIRARTLVLVGEWDVPDFRDIADVLARRIPNAHKVVIAKAGHMANMEQPEAVNRAVMDFLRDSAT